MVSWLMVAPLTLSVANVVYAFRESTFPGKMIVLLLLAGSIVAWSIMLTKAVELRNAKRASQAFLAAFRNERLPTGLFRRQRRFPDSPLQTIYEMTCKALVTEFQPSGCGAPLEGLFPEELERAPAVLKQAQLNALHDVAEGNLAEQALHLENNMGFLATAISASPFLGLLGTVWGVMDAFGGMAVRGVATLSAVAPGISAALLTTVIGLLVALPSTVGYNILTHRIRYLSVQMENFAQELTASLQRSFGED